VDVLIDKRELLEKARERKLNLGMIEKDYVLGWLLFGFSKTKFVFKGGTALSKIYFPEIWRLSEDLDFSFRGNFYKIEVEEILRFVEQESGIKFKLKSKYQNPEYLQLKIQYHALLGKNWIKVDVTKEKVIETPAEKTMKKMYPDYPGFNVNVMQLEEIFAEKLRALLERKKSRDYYDIWRMLSLKYDQGRVRKLFLEKCKIKGIEIEEENIFPENLEDILRSYWEKELSRLVYPIPDLRKAINDLKSKLTFLDL